MNIIKDNCLLWCGLKITFTRQKKKLIPLEFVNLELNIAKLLLVEFDFDIKTSTCSSGICVIFSFSTLAVFAFVRFSIREFKILILLIETPL